jgi:hypothetical protein
LRQELKDVVATAAWAVVISSVILPALYTRGSLVESDLILLFLGSVVAGLVLADLERLILSSVVAIALSLVIIYLCLNLPAFLHLATAETALAESAIVMIFRSIFPIPLIAILFGGLLGSSLGERFDLH